MFRLHFSKPGGDLILRGGLLAGMLLVPPVDAAEPTTWEIPLAGNAFITTAEDGSKDVVPREGAMRLESPKSVVSVYFHINKPGRLQVALRLAVPEGTSTLRVQAAGQSFTVEAPAGVSRIAPAGNIDLAAPGYVRVDLAGLKKSGPIFAEVESLVVTSATKDLKSSFVANNQGNMFYWGRRGPSVHLSYELPKDKDLEYGYSELTVPEGWDPVGSYFMANGFREGYFGIQVNSATERRILFSVWSPFKTDNPKDIPADARVELLAKGEGVHIGEFGNEGSGGQSYLVHPWRAGVVYRFLTSVKPDGKGSTIYAAWFGEVGKTDWRLIARFRRPQTDTHLKGFHSFLENFNPAQGWQGRRGEHGNVWVGDVKGAWHEITRARFTGDGTASGGHRLDYAGGAEGGHFFLRNGGFFNERVDLGQSFDRRATPRDRPRIDAAKLP